MTADLSPAQRGARWLLEQLNPDGSFQGTSSLEDYYKAPFALITTGHIAAAERLLDYVQKRFLLPNGDLDGRGVSWFDQFRIYPHGWLTIAALMRGRFDLAQPLLRVLESYHDEKTGGFFGTTDGGRSRRGPQDVMTTSIAGLACLWAGRLDIARRTGQWMQNLFDAQPDLAKGLYFVWDSFAGLVTRFPEPDAVSYFVDSQKTTQWYFEYGIAAAFLSTLSAATSEKKWLDLAQQFLRATQHCRDDVYNQPQSGKIGWGAAWTYRLSRSPDDLKLVQAVATGLQALQSLEGWWSAANVYDYQKGENVKPSSDVTSEFVGLLGCMELQPLAD